MVPDMLVLNLCVFIGVGLLMPIFKLYVVQRYGLSEVSIGAVVAPAALTLGLIAIPMGRLSDKWGVMVSVRLGILLCALGMWGVAISPDFKIAAFSSAFIGAGFILAYPAWMAVVSASGSPEQRGQLLGAVGMAEGIGAVIGVTIGPIIYSSHWSPVPWISHYSLPFYLSAILLSISAVIAFTWVARRRSEAMNGQQEPQPPV